MSRKHGASAPKEGSLLPLPVLALMCCKSGLSTFSFFKALIEILPNIEGFRLLLMYVSAGTFVISWVDLF